MIEHNQFLQFIAEYWQVVFIYVFKYLNDMKKEIIKLEREIAVLKYALAVEKSISSKKSEE
jgi:hypothetical protein